MSLRASTASTAVGTLTLEPILVTVSLGAKEVVFDWTTDRCEDFDVPDGPAAVRAGGGRQPGAVLRQRAALLREPRGRLRQVHRATAASRRSCRRTGALPSPTRTGNGCGRCIARATPWHALVHNEFHDADRGHLPAGQSGSGQSLLVQLGYVRGVDGRSAIVLQARRTRARRGTRALRVGATRTWRATRRQWLRRGLFRPRATSCRERTATTTPS